MMSDRQAAPRAKTPSAAGPDWRRIVFPLVLVALCGTLYFWRLGLTPLEDFDEAYYAEGAREMLERGDLGTPYFNARPFLLKPILIYWLIAGAFSLLGVTEFAARVGSAFLGTAMVLLTYWFGARTLNRRSGFLAGLGLALCYMWVDIARDASIDVPLTACLAPALFMLFLAGRAPRQRSRLLYLGAYALLGLALLAKGPVPVAVVVMGFVAYLLSAGRLRSTLAEARVVPGIALVLAVAAPWYVYEAVREPGFVSTFLVGEHLGHVHGTLARTEPWWGQVKNLFVYFSPWAAFLPAALAHAFGQQDRSHVLRFAAWWALAVVALFSFPQAKLAHYLAPAFPAAALLSAAWLDAWLDRRPVGRAWTAAAFVLIALLGLACAVAMTIGVASPGLVAERIREQYGDWSPGMAPVVMLAALAAGFLLAAISALWSRRMAVPALAGAMLVASYAHVGWFKPGLAEIQAQPRKELAQFAAAALPSGEPLGVFWAKRNATVFYARRPIVDLGEDDPESLAGFLSSPTPLAALTHAKFLPRLADLPSAPFVWQRQGDYLLLSNVAREGRPAGSL